MIPISDNDNNLGKSWQEIQNKSLNFWISVEAGRQAAYAYKKMRPQGDFKAQMNALNMISQNSSGGNYSLAKKEFEFASEQLERSSVFLPSNLVDGEVPKIVE